MKQASALFITILVICLSGAHADDIILRLRPEADAPVLTRIVATEKVLLDAAPAGENGDWKQLELSIPFEAYVPEASLTKNFAIIQDTPVHFLPDANSDTITKAKDGDLYEIKRVKDGWATVKYTKKLNAYFQAEASATEVQVPAPKPAPLPELPMPELTIPEPVHTPRAKSRGFDPNLSVGITSPDDLPPENVVWRSTTRKLDTVDEAAVEIPKLEPIPRSTAEENLNQPAIVVSREDTQAREPEARTPPTADQPHRVLTGILVREIEAVGPAYPIRLNSQDGRMIAYVDLSGIFIDDLSNYLNQRVMLRGQLKQARPNSRDLVIIVHQILPAN